MSIDIVSGFLTHLTNSIRAGKSEVFYRPVSKLIINICEVMKRHGYVKEYEVIEDGRGNIIRVVLTEYFNKAGPIKPRHSVSRYEFEKFEKRFLPARDFGILILSTDKGVISHKEAKKMGIGGVLIGYVY